MIDVLLKVSNPKRPRRVPLTTPRSYWQFCTYVPLLRLRYGARLLKEHVADVVRHTQIRSRLLVPGSNTMAYDPPPPQRHVAAPANGHKRVRVSGRPTRCIILALLEYQNERDDNLHGRLRAPSGAAHTYSSCRTNGILRLPAGDAADTTQIILRSCTGTDVGDVLLVFTVLLVFGNVKCRDWEAQSSNHSLQWPCTVVLATCIHQLPCTPLLLSPSSLLVAYRVRAERRKGDPS